MTPAEAALRAALRSLQRPGGHFPGCAWPDGADQCSQPCQSCREALAAPPHGKDAGEERQKCFECGGSGYAINVDMSQVIIPADEYRSLQTSQARLTEAEGLLREADAALESEGRLELAMRITEFLNTPKDK